MRDAIFFAEIRVTRSKYKLPLLPFSFPPKGVARGRLSLFFILLKRSVYFKSCYHCFHSPARRRVCKVLPEGVFSKFATIASIPLDRLKQCRVLTDCRTRNSSKLLSRDLDSRANNVEEIQLFRILSTSHNFQRYARGDCPTELSNLKLSRR